LVFCSCKKSEIRQPVKHCRQNISRTNCKFFGKTAVYIVSSSDFVRQTGSP
jgi:hypothetical protein